jgi:hypothetical protein
VPRCIRITFCSFIVNPMARVKTIALLGIYVGHGRWSCGRKTTCRQWVSMHLILGSSCRVLFNWRLNGALRWKAEDRRLGRVGRVLWKSDKSKVVAPVCVG